MTYKSVVNLIPTIDAEFVKRIGEWTMEEMASYQTIAFSVDDALSLVGNAREDSVIVFWNANYFSVDDLLRVNAWSNIEWRNLPGWDPYVRDVVGELPKDSDYPGRDYGDITTLTIHHTVGWDYSASTFQNAVRIARYHIQTHGWPGIGYHYLIGPAGEILQTNYLDIASYHAGSYDAPGDENKSSVGISLGGDFRNQPPTDAQIGNASALVYHLRDLVLPNSIAVLPHKRMPGAATICPGYDIDPWLRIIDGTDQWI